jgi:hypothetical protein
MESKIFVAGEMLEIHMQAGLNRCLRYLEVSSFTAYFAILTPRFHSEP